MEQQRALARIHSVNDHSTLHSEGQTVPVVQSFPPSQYTVASTATIQSPAQAQSASQRNVRNNKVTKNTSQKPRQTKQGNQTQRAKESKQTKRVRSTASHKQAQSGANKLPVGQPQKDDSPYGSPETILTCPSGYQAAFRLKINRLILKGLKSRCLKPLFVYGSLMMTDLWHDVFLEASEHVFIRHPDLAPKIYICPAKVSEYARLAIDGFHEPIMTDGKIGDCVHGMLIWGLNDEDYSILNRYEDEQFVKQHIKLPYPFEKRDVQASIKLTIGDDTLTAQAYVWPHTLCDNGGKSDVKWTVDGFWRKAPVCQNWREPMDKMFPNRMRDIQQEVRRIVLENAKELEALGTKMTTYQKYNLEQARAQEQHGRIEMDPMQTATGEAAKLDSSVAAQDLNVHDAGITAEQEPFQQWNTTQQLGRTEVAPLQTGTLEGAELHTSMAVQDSNMHHAGIAAEREPSQQWATTQEETGRNATMVPQNFWMPNASRPVSLDTYNLNGYGPATQNLGTFDASVAAPRHTWNGYGPPGPWSLVPQYIDQETTSVDGIQDWEHASI